MSRTLTLQLPPVVAHRLRATRWRFRAVVAAAGALSTLTVLFIAMMAAMLLDDILAPVSFFWRTLLTYAALAVTALMFAHDVLRPLFRRQSLSHVAHFVEAAVPDLQERWSTLSELAESRDAEPLRGSRELIDEVGLEAVALSFQVEPRAVVRMNRIRAGFIVLVVTLATLLAAFVCAPRQMTLLMRRFWSPHSAISQTRIACLSGNQAVPIGEAVALEARVTGRQRSTAALLLEEAGLPLQRVTIWPAGESHALTHPIRAVKASFRYRWECGDAQTEWFTIRAEDRPALARARFRIIPPAYTNLPEQEQAHLPRQARVLRGSRLDLRLMPSKPLSRFLLNVSGGHTQVLTEMEGAWYRYAQTLDESLSFALPMTDEHGLSSLAPPSCRIIVYADQPPTVEIVSPDDEMVVRPDDTVSVQFKATDDLGIASAELLVTTDDGKQQKTETIPIPLGEQEPSRRVEQSVQLDLKQRGLSPGTSLVYAVRVRDTRQAAALSAARSAQQAGNPGASSKPAALATAAGQPSTRPNGAPSSQPAGTAGNPASSPVDLASLAPRSSSLPSAPPSEAPPNPMTTRLLDVENGCCSNRQRLEVAEWSGSYEGKTREKLQLAISNYLQRVKHALDEAAGVTSELVSHVRAGSPWASAQALLLAEGSAKLALARSAIEELRGKSANSPYAFIGLQLVDLDLAHITPARRNLAQARGLSESRKDQLKELEQASYHIARALEQLNQLAGEFEAVKVQEKATAAAQKLAKMHQLFVENMAAMLGACKKAINPRTGRWQILPDELAEKLLKLFKDRLARKKQLQDAIAEALATDPDLLRRFMANSRKSAHTIRDQLTLLARRQERIGARVALWNQSTNEAMIRLTADSWDMLSSERAELTRLAAELYDNTITWVPRGRDLNESGLARCRALSAQIATLTRKPATTNPSASQPSTTQPAGAQPTRDEIAEETLDRIHELQLAFAEVGAKDDADAKLLAYVARRLAETDTLASRQSDWIEKRSSLLAGNHGRMMAVEQRRLTRDTREFGLKMQSVAMGLRGVSEQVGDKAGELANLIATDLVKEQSAAALGLEHNNPRPAQKLQEQVKATFARAEKLFDDLLTQVEDTIAKQPATMPATTMPSLAEQKARFLEALENEADACEKLGAVIHQNIMVRGDWMKPGNDGLGGIGAGYGQQPDDQRRRGDRPPHPEEQSANRGHGNDPSQDKSKSHEPGDRAEARAGGEAEDTPPSELQRAMAEARANQEEARTALEEAAKAMDREEQQASGRRARDRGRGGGIGSNRSGRRDAASVGERDWNVFVSKLKDELRQGRENVPPEQYRQAIDDYFRDISQRVSRSSTQPAESGLR